MLSQLIYKPSLDSLGLPFTAILTFIEAAHFQDATASQHF